MIIALCGASGAGKSTLADLLTRSRLGFVKAPFALPIKVMLGSLLELQGVKELPQMLNGDLREVPTPYLSGQTPRYAMRTLGTEWGRELMHDNFWVEIWRNGIRNRRKVVVDDLRFSNELIALREMKAIVVKVVRDDITHPEISHISELQFPSFEVDLTIVNDGTPTDMLRELQHFLGPSLLPSL